MPTKTAEAKKIESQPEVKVALREATHQPPSKPPVEKKDKFSLGTYALVLLGLLGMQYALGLGVFEFAQQYRPILHKIIEVALVVIVVLAVSKAIELFLIRRVASTVARYNLKRVLKLVAGLVLFFMAISILFVNWYTAVVSLGLISLILGFALQTPITSFIGWIYILAKAPYQVGDRIKIGDSMGDVIDVSYLDTTLWEFGGDYLSTDHPSGRIIKFPNSAVLQSHVYNYSWALFPYIWNEIKFHIAYESDLEFVAQTMQDIAKTELGEEMPKRVQVYRDLLKKTPVNELEVREHPRVVFRVSDNTWLEAIVRYLVHPKEAGRIKSRLIQQMLKRLNAAPDRVMFPKSNQR